MLFFSVFHIRMFLNSCQRNLFPDSSKIGSEKLKLFLKRYFCELFLAYANGRTLSSISPKESVIIKGA